VIEVPLASDSAAPKVKVVPNGDSAKKRSAGRPPPKSLSVTSRKVIGPLIVEHWVARPPASTKPAQVPMQPDKFVAIGV
jgi:hypothetical protein